MLERAGWTFVRVRGSRFYRDPARALQPVWEKLDDLGIPTGQWRVPPAKAEVEIELRRAKLKSDEALAGKGQDREMKVSTRINETHSGPAKDREGDPWGAAFSAADKALRRHTQSDDDPNDHSAG